jgi:hypothetical protein
MVDQPGQAIRDIAKVIVTYHIESLDNTPALIRAYRRDPVPAALSAKIAPAL